MTSVTFKSVKFSEELDEEPPQPVTSSGSSRWTPWTTFCPPLFPDRNFDRDGLLLVGAIFTTPVTM